MCQQLKLPSEEKATSNFMKNLPHSSLTMFPENFAAMMILYNTVPNKSAVLLTFIFYRSIFHLLSQFKWGEIGV